MGKSISSKPLIQAGWLRVLLYILAFLILCSLSALLYVIWLHGRGENMKVIQNILIGEKSAGVDLFLFVLTLALTFVFRKWIDRRPFVTLGLSLHGYSRDALSGALLAITIVGGSSLILKATGSLKWTDIIFDVRSLFLSLGTILFVAFYEELIFRGYLLSNLMNSFSKWIALGISALLFMAFHWNGTGFFPLINTLIIGLILGLNYLYTGNLWFSVFFHAAWKFLEGPLLGFPGQGLTQTLLQPDFRGDENITGGASGLEGSYIFMTISLLGLLALYLLLQKKFSPQSPPVPGRI